MDIISYTKAKRAQQSADNVQSQLDQAIAAGDQLAEVQQARVDADGNTYTTLKERIDTDHSETKAEFQSVNAQLAEKANALEVNSHFNLGANDKDVFPEILDMHYDTLKGVGWHPSDPGGEITKTITADAAKGTYDLTLSSVTSLYADQLITIYSGGEYYSNVIKSIASNVVTLTYPLEIDVLTNDTLHNFYVNSFHPNIYGYRTIADNTLRNVIKPRGYKLFKRALPADFTYSSGTSVTNGGFKQDYTEPFAEYDTKVVTVAAGEAKYAIYTFTIDQDKYLKFRTKVSVGDGLSLNYQISDDANTTAFYNTTYDNLGDGKTQVIEISTFLRKGSYNLKMRLITTPGSFAIGKTEIFELSNRYDLQMFDKGVHLLLGDSWFEMEGIYERLVERFPKATFINFGVGGNRSEHLVRRFNGTATDADIKNDPTNYGDRKDATTIPIIDYVWVMCGTNDYNQAVTTSTFKDNIDTLVKDIINRGAKPLIFTSSVGDINDDTNFTLSREYADLYYGKQYSVNDIVDTYFEEGSFSPTIAGTTTAGTHTYDVQEGLFRRIGKTVFFSLRVRMSVKDANMAGLIIVKGLPYNPVRISALALSRADYVSYGTTGKQLVAVAETNGEISINKIIDNGGSIAVVAGDTANNTMFYISGTYPII